MAQVEHVAAPDCVDFVYRKVGDTHIFASKGIRGLVHVGGDVLRDVYDQVLTALNIHVHKTYGVEARYICQEDFAEFERKVGAGDGQIVMAVLDNESRACH